MTKADAVVIAAIEAGVPSLVEARTLIDQFHDMIRKKDDPKLDAWIANAKASLVSSFATGVLKDIAAVRAAITPPWSNGRLRNSNLSNDKCMGARKLTFSKHDCSVQHDPRRRHQTCVRAKFEHDDVIAVSAGGTKAALASSSCNQPIRRSCHEAIRRARCLAKRNRSMRGQRDWAINLRGNG
jgi:hypothetical protein